MNYSRRLVLESVYNCRDLGGYATKNGKRTKFGVYVRSELPMNTSENDVNFLFDYGIKTVLDLRFVVEAESRPCVFKDMDEIRYIIEPLFPDIKSDEDVKKYWTATEDAKNDPLRWAKEYINMVEKGKNWTKNVIEIAANCDGAMLFHCYTGKDRTGIIAALLLGIAGVPTEDIAANYSESQSFLDPFFAKNMKVFNKEDRVANMAYSFLYTSPTNMFILMDHFEKKYGGVENYLRSCDISDEVMDKIRDKFVEK